MNELLYDFAQWTNGLPLGTLLRTSPTAYPLIETTHVLFLGLFLGTLLMVNVRLLGLSFRTVSISEMNARLLPYTLAGAIVMLGSGVALFVAVPLRSTQSLFFRVKVLLLLGALLNAWWFNRQLRKAEREQLDVVHAEQLPSPTFARVAAVLSIVGWLGVAICGRLMATPWFDCDRQPQSDLVNSFAGCLVGNLPPPLIDQAASLFADGTVNL